VLLTNMRILTSRDSLTLRLILRSI
jgi:hypothetical protein